MLCSHAQISLDDLIDLASIRRVSLTAKVSPLQKLRYLQQPK